MEWFSQDFYRHCNGKNILKLKYVNGVPWRTALCGWYSSYLAQGWEEKSVSLMSFLQFSLLGDTSEYPGHRYFGFYFFFELHTSSSLSLLTDLSNWSIERFSFACRYVFLLPTGYSVIFTGVPPAAAVTLQTISVFTLTKSLPKSGSLWLSVFSLDAAFGDGVIACWQPEHNFIPLATCFITLSSALINSAFSYEIFRSDLFCKGCLCLPNGSAQLIWFLLRAHK